MATATEIKHQICMFFGGPYDETSRAYLSPTVPGLGAVRRARGRRSNRKELHGGMGTEVHGSVMLVHVQSGKESRRAFAGAHDGIKHQSYEVVLHVFLHSTARAAEDAQDAFDELRDGLLARFRSDRTLGSGGFETGGFQAAEGEGELRWEMDPVETAGTVTRGYLIVAFDADAYIHA